MNLNLNKSVLKSSEVVIQSGFLNKRVLKEFGEICKKISVLESLLDWRPVYLLKRDSCTGVFRLVLQKKKKKKLRTNLGEDISERLHFNLYQPSVLKYLFTTLQSNKAFRGDFICCLMSNFRGVIRTLSNIQGLVFIIVMRNGKATFLWLCFYLLTIAQNDSSIRQYVC